MPEDLRAQVSRYMQDADREQGKPPRTEDAPAARRAPEKEKPGPRERSATERTAFRGDGPRIPERQVRPWVKAQRAKGIRRNLLTGAAGLLLAAVVLGVTWAVILMTLVGGLGVVDMEWAAWAALAVLLLLFLLNLITPEGALADLEFDNASPTGSRYAYGGHVNPLGPNTMRSGVKMIASVFLCGPRLATGALRALGRARQLGRCDVGECTAVFAVLLSVDAKVSYADILKRAPGLDPNMVFRQVLYFEGVIAIRSEPPGLTLISSLREQWKDGDG